MDGEHGHMNAIRPLDLVRLRGRPEVGRVAEVDVECEVQVCLCKEGRQYMTAVHVMVLNAFIGPCPAGMEACHWDGNPANNTLDNLRWDTASANVTDSIRHGTHRVPIPRGILNGHSVLTEEDVRAIRRSPGFQRDIAKVYGVPQSSISKIKARKAWSDVV